MLTFPVITFKEDMFTFSFPLRKQQEEFWVRNQDNTV